MRPGGARGDTVSMSARQPTSHDVARAAGVSQSTVSYALSGKGTIAPRTREHVLAVAASMGYRPNLAARSMRTQRSGRLAVVTGVTVDNRLRMLTGAAEVAAEAGYALDTHSVDGTAEARTERVVDLARSGQVEGVLTFLPWSPTRSPWTTTPRRSSPRRRSTSSSAPPASSPTPACWAP